MPNSVSLPQTLDHAAPESVPDQLHVLDESFAADESAATAAAAQSPAAMRFLMDVQLPVTISFGRARLPLREVARLEAGAVIPLDRGADDPIEVIVNGAVIARGRVVSVDGCYGVLIEETIDTHNPIQSHPAVQEAVLPADRAINHSHHFDFTRKEPT